MAEPKQVKTIKKPTLFLALLPIITMVLLLCLGYVMFELPPEPLIIASTVVAGIIAIKLGYSYNDILESISQKIAKTMPAILILICVGLMIGAWMVGGTIPMMIFYGLKIINPQFLLITAFLVTSVVSICTGTSWGSAGTIGVAFMGVGAGLDANLAAVAGAVVAGAYFGDKLSPLSDTTNIASLSTGVNLYEHIGHLLYTTLPSFVVAGIAYVITGLNTDGAGASIPEKVGIDHGYAEHDLPLELLACHSGIDRIVRIDPQKTDASGHAGVLRLCDGQRPHFPRIFPA
ncbi:Na+/H+ antiporter NhaC family protein [Paenibacillus sp. JTLBN-2024]